MSFLVTVFTEKSSFSTYPKTSNHEKLCFLQLNLSIFMLYLKIDVQKHDPKNTSKIVKKCVHKPEKRGSCRDETVGCEK